MTSGERGKFLAPTTPFILPPHPNPTDSSSYYYEIDLEKKYNLGDFALKRRKLSHWNIIIIIVVVILFFFFFKINL